jgi:hypothetical protein
VYIIILLIVLKLVIGEESLPAVPRLPATTTSCVPSDAGVALHAVCWHYPVRTALEKVVGYVPKVRRSNGDGKRAGGEEFGEVQRLFAVQLSLVRNVVISTLVLRSLPRGVPRGGVVDGGRAAPRVHLRAALPQRRPAHAGWVRHRRRPRGVLSRAAAQAVRGSGVPALHAGRGRRHRAVERHGVVRSGGCGR